MQTMGNSYLKLISTWAHLMSSSSRTLEAMWTLLGLHPKKWLTQWWRMEDILDRLLLIQGQGTESFWATTASVPMEAAEFHFLLISNNNHKSVLLIPSITAPKNTPYTLPKLHKPSDSVWGLQFIHILNNVIYHFKIATISISLWSSHS